MSNPKRQSFLLVFLGLLLLPLPAQGEAASTEEQPESSEQASLVLNPEELEKTERKLRALFKGQQSIELSVLRNALECVLGEASEACRRMRIRLLLEEMLEPSPLDFEVMAYFKLSPELRGEISSWFQMLDKEARRQLFDVLWKLPDRPLPESGYEELCSLPETRDESEDD